MSKIKAILWDVDSTLLNFAAAEYAAIYALFDQFQLGPCNDEMVARYVEINHRHWAALERGEMTKPQVLVGRFEEFFKGEGIDPAVAVDFNEAYQYKLGDTIVLNDNCLEILNTLRGKVKQYVVSNGTIKAQTKKLDRSGIGVLMDDIFLSEYLGIEKPNIGFFKKVFEQIGHYESDEIIIIGDSLTSDIQGGINAGILTCWYNPTGKEKPTDLPIDYIIKDLHEVYGILGL